MLRRLASGAALAAVAAVVLAGCTPPEPVETTPVPTPTVSATASGNSEEELLARSFEVSVQLLALVDRGFREGSLPSDDLREIASAELIAMIDADLAEFQQQGLQVSGSSGLDSPSLISNDPDDDGGGALVLATCWDTSGTRTTGPDGEVVSGGVTRQPRLFEIQYSASDMLVTRTGPPAQDLELPACG
ncbi:hypothetical protein [Agrococcus citreus]|uniref:Uncharacterized protein n=1 Tax=Agrococcus citreus TaxID=84643 RepID=A0ABN1YUJ9_9MICO